MFAGLVLPLVQLLGLVANQEKFQIESIIKISGICLPSLATW